MLHVEQGHSSYAYADAHAFPDPLDEDVREDDRVVLTRRRLIRLALVAAETGARFQRDGIAHDPMAWMLAPRRAFGGRAPLDACQDLADCTRALLIHGLGIALDPSVDEIDYLLEDQVDDAEIDAAAAFVDAASSSSCTTALAPFCAA